MNTPMQFEGGKLTVAPMGSYDLGHIKTMPVPMKVEGFGQTNGGPPPLMKQICCGAHHGKRPADRSHFFSSVPFFRFSMTQDIVVFSVMALDAEGQIWSWGEGRDGQLGHGTHTDRKMPKKIITRWLNPHLPVHTAHCTCMLTRSSSWLCSGLIFTQISGGVGHSAALTIRGRVFTWGSGATHTWHSAAQHSTAQHAYDTNQHTHARAVALTAAPSGSGENGQSGHGETGPGVKEVKPKEVVALLHEEIDSIICGATATGAVTTAGDVIMWGFGEHFYPPDYKSKTAAGASTSSPGSSRPGGASNTASTTSGVHVGGAISVLTHSHGLPARSLSAHFSAKHGLLAEMAGGAIGNEPVRSQTRVAIPIAMF